MPKFKYNQKLPKNVEKRLDAYIERIKAIKWFKPSPGFKREDAEKQVAIALKAFGVEASIEWCSLKTKNDLDAARDAAWSAAYYAAYYAARGAEEELVKDLPVYKGKCAYLSLIPLWEMGLYPIGVVGGKFLIYQPE